jgi:hypothetical protein
MPRIPPLTNDRGPSETAWIPITDGSTKDELPGWSPDGNWIYVIQMLPVISCPSPGKESFSIKATEIPQ